MISTKDESWAATIHLRGRIRPRFPRSCPRIHEQRNTDDDEAHVDVFLERILLPQEGPHEHHGDGLAALAQNLR